MLFYLFRVCSKLPSASLTHRVFCQCGAYQPPYKLVWSNRSLRIPIASCLYEWMSVCMCMCVFACVCARIFYLLPYALNGRVNDRPSQSRRSVARTFELYKSRSLFIISLVLSLSLCFYQLHGCTSAAALMNFFFTFHILLFASR